MKKIVLLLLISPLSFGAFDKNLNLEIYPTVITTSPEVMGMGGARSSIANRSSELHLNPAAVANKQTTNWFDYDWHWSFTTIFGGEENNQLEWGEKFENPAGSIRRITAGGLLRFGKFGFGIALETLREQLCFIIGPGPACKIGR